MKRKFKSTTLALIMMALTIFLIACNDSGNTGSTNANTSTEENNSSERDVKQKEDKSLQQRENKAEEQKADEEVEPKLEIVNETGVAWQDGVFANWVSSSIIVENTGEVPIKIGETEMHFKDTNDEIIGTSSLNHAIPEIIEPGQQAYINDFTMLDKEIDVEEYKETTYKFSFEKTSDRPNLLEVSDIESIINTDDPLKPYFTVTAVVTNTTDEVPDEVRIAAALYAEDGSFLGILRNKSTPTLEPGSEIKLEVALPHITREIVDQVETIEVKAYGR